MSFPLPGQEASTIMSSNMSWPHSFLYKEPYNVNVLMLSQRSLKCDPHFSKSLSSFSDFHPSVFDLPIHFSVSSNLLVVPSSVFCLSVVFFIQVWLFLYFLTLC